MQHSQVMSNRDDETWAPQVNQQGGTKQNFTYFAIGFSVISLTINKPMLEKRLESIQHWASGKCHTNTYCTMYNEAMHENCAGQNEFQGKTILDKM